MSVAISAQASWLSVKPPGCRSSLMADKRPVKWPVDDYDDEGPPHDEEEEEEEEKCEAPRGRVMFALLRELAAACDCEVIHRQETKKRDKEDKKKKKVKDRQAGR